MPVASPTLPAIPSCDLNREKWSRPWSHDPSCSPSSISPCQEFTYLIAFNLSRTKFALSLSGNGGKTTLRVHTLFRQYILNGLLLFGQCDTVLILKCTSFVELEEPLTTIHIKTSMTRGRLAPAVLARMTVFTDGTLGFSSLRQLCLRVPLLIFTSV